MVNAGASIEAFLKLDASGFNKGIESATSSVTKFKESMLDVGKEANTFNTGVNSVSKALDALIRKMSLLDSVDSKAVNNFKTMASALLDVATAAQRLSVDSMRGHRGIEALNTIMEVFRTGVSSAEIVINNLSASITNMANVTVNDMEKVKVSFKSAQESLMELSRGVLPFNRIDSESNKVKESVRIMDSEFKRAKEDLLSLGQGIPSFNRINAESNRVKESVRLMDEEFKRAKADLLAIGQGVPAFNRINAESNKVKESIRMMDNEFKRAKQDLMDLSQGALAFNRINADSNKVKESVRMMDTEFKRAKQDLLDIGQGALAFNRIETGTQRAKAELQLYEAELQKSSAKAQAMWNQNTASINKTTSATQRAATATNRLSKAFSSLRMMGTMVGSMLVWNFAHNLITATRETVNAKSEMEGYFKMLHFNQSEIGNFNKALDNTVSQFQRINKYALGETISSIGVEFNLTTKEMEKAMPVVSMITSEYLRAGRNVNEASLAVKDILQGEFQRLSRETGVKGDQLKEAGWSGDKNDVMGLLDALEKVGKSRNWDVFVTKANSLNDAVLILQNRFSEWTAEMVNVVQPSILFVFNSLMSIGGAFGNVFSGIWRWLNGDGIANQVVKWTSLATAIGSVVTALIHYRTGANLAQIVQMGLRGTITATVLGLKAEEVATYGTRNAIAAKITSLKAEQVSLMGVRNALLTKALGLKAETVATLGLKGAIMEEVLGRRLQKAEIQGASVYQKMAIVNEYEEQVAKKGTLASIFAKIAGVKMETFAEKGLIVALAERIASTPLYVGSLKAEEVAELSTAEAGYILMGSLLPLVAIITGVAIALYALIKPLQDASEEMKAFNTLNKDGDNIIKEHKKTYDGLAKSYDNTKSKLDKLQQGSDKYLRTQDKLNALEKDKQTAYDNWQNSIKAVEMTRSRQAKFEETKTEIAIHNQTRLKDAYIKAGFSAKEASEMASGELREAEKGAEQLRHALQMIKLEADKGAEKQEKTIDMLKQYGLDEESIKKYGNNLADANAKVTEGMEKFMTSEDLMDRMGGWLEIQQGRLEEWWTEINAFFEVRDWNGIRDKLIEGFKYVITGFGAFNWVDGLKESIDKKGIWGTLMEWLWGEGDSDGVLDIVGQWANDMIFQPIADWLNWFLADPVAHFDQIESDLATSIGQFLFGKDSKPINEIIGDWFNNTIIQPTLDKVYGLPQFILDSAGNLAFDWGKSLYTLIFGEDAWSDDFTYDKLVNEVLPNLWNELTRAITDFFSGSSDSGGGTGGFMKKIDVGNLLSMLLGLGDSLDFSWANDFVNNYIITPLQTAWNNFLTNPLEFISSTLTVGGLLNAFVNSEEGSSLLTWVNEKIVTPLSQGIQTGIANIPIIGSIAQMLGLISQDDPMAQDEGSKLMRAFGNAVTTTIGQIPIIGDIARMLGLIPQENPDAHSKGKGVGDSIKDGVMNGLNNLGSQVIQEFNDALGGIGKLGEEAYNTAKGWADQLWQGVNSILQRASPGFFHDQFKLEFGQDIPNAITEAGSTAYTVAQAYGQSIKDGISETSFNTVGFDSAVGIYQDDAQIVADSSQYMGTTTATAFNQMTTSVNQSTTQMQGNVATTYTGMQQKQQSSLNTMRNQNLQAYNDMYLKSNQSLIQMRDSTSNVTHQMTNAWTHMKDQIVASANKLKSDSTSHFNQLSNTIGGFYRKIQNPSNWGAGVPTRSSSARKPSTGRRIATRIASNHGAGINPYQDSKSISLRDLMRMTGVSDATKLDLNTFLASIWGEHGFGWDDWSGNHYSYIKSTSDNWNMKAPMIMGRIQAGNGYKVGEFENGTPHMTWDSFMTTAEAVFNAIPYKFYWDSNWKGDWVSAIKAGACNCSDGSEALIALAQTFGFDGYKQHTVTRGGLGHFYAVINGRKMDTTHFQNSGSWTPLGAGIPTRTSNPSGGAFPQGNKTVNVNVEISGTVYGVDDLDSKIQESVKEGLRAEFNDPYTVAI